MFDDRGTTIFALGGLGEVGKNTYCIETKNAIIIIDAGVKFSEDNLPGIKYIIPNYEYLKLSKKNKFLFITHGHEDHIGAINVLLAEVNVLLIYAPKFAAALIRNKMSMSNNNRKLSIIEYDESSFFKINNGEIKISFFRVTHSIPDSFGIIFETSDGRIATTGDFKIDLTPVLEKGIELNKIAYFGSKGIDLLMSDSTNAEIEGNTPSEKIVYQSTNNIFHNTVGRIIVSTFSSNISRIQQIISIARQYKRKVAIVGRSMELAVQFARKNGYIKIKNDDLIDMSEIKNLHNHEICIICTGSQGEPGSVLSKIANNEHKIHIKPGDTVVFSSSPIPGNNEDINFIVNVLVKSGAIVFTNGDDNLLLHSSGHPSKQDLKLMLKLFQPNFFMPIHGNYSMLKSHANVAKDVGIKEENIFVLENGNSIILKNHHIVKGPNVIANYLYLEDNSNIKSIPANVIEERKKIVENGIAIITLLFNADRQIIAKPEIEFIGFNVDKNVCLKIIDHVYNDVIQNLKINSFVQEKINSLVIEILSKDFIQFFNKNMLIVPFIMLEE